MPHMKLRFAVIGLNHGHIYAMISGLLKTGEAECVSYFADEPKGQAQMKKAFPEIPLATCKEAIFEDPSIQLVCIAAINNERGPLTARVLASGKDVFVDKPAVTTLADLDEVERAQQQSGRSWFVWYGERLMDTTSQKALELVREGVVGPIVNFIGLGPHKLTRHTRPPWMFTRGLYGGILNDLAIHQVEMFTQLCGAKPGVISSRVGNFGNPDRPGFEDFGDATLVSPSGATAYVRVDWFTPDTMPTYGDIRNFIMGTKGTLELRKTVDLAVDNNRFTGQQLLLTTHDQEPHRISCADRKITFYEDLIRDVREGANRCVPHELSFAACRATLEAQTRAMDIQNPGDYPPQ